MGRVPPASLKGCQPLDGHDLSGVLLQKGPSPRREILHNINFEAGGLRHDDWKLIVRYNEAENLDRTELFNLSNDPGENRNLSETEPEKTAELLEILEQYRKEAAPARGGRMPMPENFEVPEVWGEFDKS